ncbi:uncharacterized protein BP5553_02638 [Venustampulla echinocandica]|uniref:Uncharacterized protein n=1 Tax=Venustampulla echinocandica TaxID=2656787 RepID=A0A370TS39_9HELO|nr:uncharacterized protein BP5553_02638 [Venustampulla echinocandica]RDL38298.1 hypothetical protein BP5553_02638 [Venustampulla echinocandica]
MSQPATKERHSYCSEHECQSLESQAKTSKAKRFKLSNYKPSSDEDLRSLPDAHTYPYPYNNLSPPITTNFPPVSATMPLQIQPITPRRGDIDQIQPIVLTPGQRAVHGGPTPELNRFPRHVFPQLRSLTKQRSRKLPLGLEPLPKDYEYVVRPERSFGNNHLRHGPTPRLPPSPWGGPKKEYPTAYYVRQMEMARPTVGPDPFYKEPLPPKVAPFQVFVMCIWGCLAQWLNTAAVMGVLSRGRRLSEGVAAVLLSWGKALLKVVLLFFWLVVVFPAKVATRVLKAYSFEVEFLFLAIMVASWFSGRAGPAGGEGEMEIGGDKPLYILRVPSGGGGSSGCRVYRCA